MYELIVNSLAGQANDWGEESGESHAKVVSCKGMFCANQICFFCDIKPLNICTMQLNVND